MAHDGTGSGWDVAAPANSDARKDGAKEIRDLRIGVGLRVLKEHVAAAAGSVGGEHKAGSCMVYYGGSAPTKKPDGSTNLHATEDLGRLWNDAGVLKYWNGTTWVAQAAATAYSVAILTDVLSAGTAGGSIAAGSWVTRPLNTELDPSGITSISANAFSLAAGTYEIECDAQIFAGDAHQARLYNVTDAAVVTGGLGSCEFASSSSPFGETSSKIRVVFTLAGTKSLRIEHRVTTNGQFGKAPSSAFGVSCIYTQVVIRKLA